VKHKLWLVIGLSFGGAFAFAQEADNQSIRLSLGYLIFQEQAEPVRPGSKPNIREILPEEPALQGGGDSSSRPPIASGSLLWKVLALLIGGSVYLRY
jgi:hypothetical protein